MAGLRISDPKELERLKQKGMINAKDMKVSVQSKLQPKKKKAPSRILTDPITGYKFCAYPPADPGAWLHIALVKAFGSIHEGGSVATEMIIPGHEKRFRFDYAILSAKVVIEFDGFGSHKTLESFKRDRIKNRHAVLNGWLPYSVTNSDVRNNLQQIIDDLIHLTIIRPRFTGTITPIGLTQCEYKE